MLSRSDATSTRRDRFAVALLAASVAAPALSFAAGPLLARTFGPEGRGSIAAAVTAFLMLQYLATFGAREAAAQSLQWTEWTRTQTARAAVVWAGSWGAALGLIAWVVAPVIFPKDPAAMEAFRWIAPLIPMAAVSNALGLVLIGGRRTRAVVVHLLAQSGVRLIGAVAIFASGSSSIRLGVLVSVGGILVALWAAFAGVNFSERSQVNLADMSRMWALAARLAPGQAAAIGSRRLDQLLLAGLAGSGELGLYVVAVAVAEVPDLVTRTIRQLAITDDSGDHEHTILMRRFRVGLPFWFAAAVFVLVLSPVAIPLLFGSDFSGAVRPALILIAASGVGYVRDVLGVHLIRQEFGLTNSAIQVGSLVVAVAALVFLAPSRGATGAALAATLSYTIGAICMIVVYDRTAPRNWGRDLVPRWRELRDRGVL